MERLAVSINCQKQVFLQQTILQVFFYFIKLVNYGLKKMFFF